MVIVDDKYVKEVASWIHNERQCVSIVSITHRLGLSRGQASEILQRIVATKKGDCIPTSCLVDKQQTRDGIPLTVFRLRTGFSCVPQNDEAERNSLYALAPCCDGVAEELLSTAHQRDMVHVLDLLADNNLGNLLNPATMDVISPSKAIQDKYQASVKFGFSPGDNMIDANEASDAKPVLSTSSLSRGRKKITTAESFFNSKKSSAAAAKTEDVVERNTNPKSNGEHQKQDQEKENLSTTAAARASARKSSSTKTVNQANDSVTIGNADDFIGDNDDDDDEEEEEGDQPMVPEAPRPESAPTSTIEPIVVDNSIDAVELSEMPTVNGAMDAFATVKKTRSMDTGTTDSIPKRRRKKLVDKTTVDEHGYFHVEKVEVWEEIPSDEEGPSLLSSKLPSNLPAPGSRVAKKESKGKSNFKQGTLMGFLKKK